MPRGPVTLADTQPSRGDGANGMGSMRSSAGQVVRNWAGTTPAGTRLVVYAGLVGAVLGLFSVFYYSAGCNCAAKTLIGFQIHRLVLAPFVGRGFLFSLFAIFSMYQIGGRLETKRGTMFFVFSTLLLAISTQFVTLLLSLPFGMVDRRSIYLCNGGFWPTVFTLMVLEAHESKESMRKFMCFPVDVPTTAYPWILALLFFVIGQSFSFDIIVALFIGWLYSNIPSLQITNQRCRNLEMTSWLQKLCEMDAFVGVDNVGMVLPGQWGQAPDSSNLATGSLLGRHDSPSQQGRASSPARTPFSGKGYTLGSASSANESPAAAPVQRGMHPLAMAHEAKKNNESDPSNTNI